MATTLTTNDDRILNRAPVTRRREREAVGDFASVAGRILFAVPFGVFGVNHFLNAKAMAGMVPVAGGEFWVYLTGAAMIAASLAILLKRFGVVAALGLALLMLTFVVTVHLPGLSNPQMKQMAMISLLKDLALAGGALTWASIFARREGPVRRVTV